MIAVIGGAMVSVRIKMVPTKMNDAGAGMGDSMYGDVYGGMGSRMPQEFVQQPGEAVSVKQDDITVENLGCGFNIAKHLAEYGKEAAYISVVGEDPLGLAIMEELRTVGVDISGVKRTSGTTPIRTETLNILGDIEDVKCNDALYSMITPDYIAASSEILDKADIIAVDGCLPKETIDKIIELYGDKENIKLFFDPGSIRGADKVEDILDKMYCVLPGRMEAERMTHKTILCRDQLMEAGAYLSEKGIEKVIITMKGGGIYYKDGFNEGVVNPGRVLSFAQTSGAGDVVSAAVIAGTAEGKTIDEIANYAIEKADEFLSDRSDERPIDMYNK